MKGIKLRSLIILAMLVLSASGAMAYGGAGSVVVDIVGSDVEDTTVFADGQDDIDLEIIGSTAKNTTVSPYKEEIKICPSYPVCPPFPECPTCPPCPNPICPICPTCPVCPAPICPNENLYKEKMPWANMHLGVDAWYGAFWYNDRINLPKWPQI